MKISVLCDNNAGRWTKAEHGLSFFIEEGSDKILFDTGSTDVFLHNAEYLGLDLSGVDIVLSHGHDDHMGGLRHLEGNSVLAHSGIFTRRFRKKDDSRMDLIYSMEEMNKKFSLTLSVEACKIGENLHYLGEIPRITSFESKTTPFYLHGGEDDFVTDDTGIAAVTPKGIVVISGCAHSGICNMIEHAKKVTGIDKVYSVIGGFHLLDRSEQTVKTVQYFKDNSIDVIYPCHCSVFPAMSYIYENIPFDRMKTGDVIEF